MRILIDIQGCQSDGSRCRGIGRYSISLVKALIRNHPEHQYILFANSTLCDLTNEFYFELNDTKYNVIYYKWFSPGPFNDETLLPTSRRWIACQLRSYSIQILNVDVILITSFFETFSHLFKYN